MIRNRAHVAVAAGVLAGLALTSTLVLRTTQAVFSGTTSTPSNSWATGGAAISNDASATAVFDTATDGKLTGGQVLTRCIVVSYTGTSTATGVRLYATASGALATSLNVVIDQGSGTSGGVGSCTGFTTSTAGIYTGTLANLASTATNYATGAGSWAPVAGATMTYRFTVTVANTTAAQNSSATGAFTWEAQA